MSIITNEAAEALLKAMVEDSAFEFKGGVEQYVSTERKLRKCEKDFAREIDNIREDFKDNEAFVSAINKIEIIVNNWQTALENKQIAVRNIKNEHLFLSGGGGTLQPPIDGAYVMRELIKQVLTDMNEDDFEEVFAIAHIARMNK